MPKASSAPAGRALVERRIGPETIVYDRSTHQAHCLGAVAASVWRSWAGGWPAPGIAGRVEAETGEKVDALAVEIALRRLERAGLVDGSSRPRRAAAAPAVPPTPARREALRRLAALASLAVASLAVPTPDAAAATCTRQLGQTCSTSSQCCPTGSGARTCCAWLRGTCELATQAICRP